VNFGTTVPADRVEMGSMHCLDCGGVIGMVVLPSDKTVGGDALCPHCKQQYRCMVDDNDIITVKSCLSKQDVLDGAA